MLRVRIRIIVLILRNVILLKLHVLLSTRWWTFNTGLPPCSRVRFGPLVKSLGFYFKDFENKLRNSKQSCCFCLKLIWRYFVLEGKPQSIQMSDEKLYLWVATSKARQDKTCQSFDFRPNVFVPRHILPWGLWVTLNVVIWYPIS
jgi:hypothetical protein